VAAARDFALTVGSPDSLDADCESSYLASVSATLTASMGPGNLLDAEGVGAAVIEQQGLVLTVGRSDDPSHPQVRGAVHGEVRICMFSAIEGLGAGGPGQVEVGRCSQP
jgi:hypothetical protein